MESLQITRICFLDEVRDFTTNSTNLIRGNSVQ